MPDNIIGMLFNHNEGDILEEIIVDAAKHVDSLFIADDNSTDSSWDIIQSLKNCKIEYVRNTREDPRDTGQRQSLLNEIRKRYKPENTWVQVIDADVRILDTNIREAIKDFSIDDVSMAWRMLNAVRFPGTWKKADTYPNWDGSIFDIMPYGHILEDSLYTFRPLSKLEYNLDKWRPWPQGFSNYTNKQILKISKKPGTPLLAHYGYRGPTHIYTKFSKRNKLKLEKYKSWDLSSVESIEKTVYYFNGQWNDPDQIFPMSRDGWMKWREENDRVTENL